MLQNLNWNFNYEFNGEHHSQTKFVIYKIENTISNKIYIGQTRRELRFRWANHKHSLLSPIKKDRCPGTNIKLKRSTQYHFKKNGNVDFLKFSIIEIVNVENFNSIQEKQKALFEREVFWIKNYKELYGSSKIYNILEGEYHSVFTNNHKSKISEAKINFYKTKKGIELRKKLSQIHTGKILTVEHKKNIGKAHKGMRLGENHPLFGKTGALNPMFGKKHTEDSKRKMSQNKIGKQAGMSHPMAKVWDLSKNPILSPTNEIFYRIECLSIFCKEHNLQRSHLRSVIKGKLKSHKGWRLKLSE